MLPFPNQFCPLAPTDKQRAFLDLECLEAFFGGAAGGGKSIALLMGALQYVDVPGYAALILRKDTQRLALPGGLIPRSHEWLAERSDVKWNGARREWTFPLGGGPPATLTFGYLSDSQVKFRYASSEFQYIAFDELTELPEADYLFLFSRLRRARTVDVPLRIRSASNPGNIGHLWVKQRFVDAHGSRFNVQGSMSGHSDSKSADDSTLSLEPGTLNASSGLEPETLNLSSGRVFLPSRLADNPHLDAGEYRRSLVHLDPLARERLLNGDWSVQEQGLIRPAWLRYYVELSPQGGPPVAQGGPPLAECGPLVPSGQEQRGAAPSWANVSSRASASSPPLSDRAGRTTLDLLHPDGRSLAQVDPAKCRRFITVDPAGTSADRAREARGRPPSHTVAQVWDQPRGELSRFLILRHQVRDLLGFDEIVATLARLYDEWRPERIWIENEKLGRATIDQLQQRLPIDAVPTGGQDKATRASTLILKFSRGEIFLPKHESAWLAPLEAEMLAWTGADDQPTDQIDAAAYAAIISQTAAPGILRIEHIVSR